MDLTGYRAGNKEQDRIANLLALAGHGASVLDVGAREGYLAGKLVKRYASVTALDLKRPEIQHPSIICVEGDAACLPFPDGSFDLVLCAEVLEHIPAAILPKVAQEIARVAGKRVLIGVPYRQDTRLGRTTCRTCGSANPPWGHVNEFDEGKLEDLFAGLRIEKIGYIGLREGRTNALSARLMDFAGNPYGAYDQEEPCIHCGAALMPPRTRNLIRKVATKASLFLNRLQAPFVPAAGNWIHVLFSKS